MSKPGRKRPGSALQRLFGQCAAFRAHCARDGDSREKRDGKTGGQLAFAHIVILIVEGTYSNAII